MDETNWVDCLAEGAWQAMNGDWVSFSKEDLEAIVTHYDPSKREAPLVFGHPAVDDPAFGWPSRMRVILDPARNRHVLQTKFTQVPQAVKDLVDQGRYAKISMSFMPDKKTIRHFGLLGAAQPAVDGLRRVSFAAGERSIDIEFASKADPDPQIERRNDMKTVEQLTLELAAEQQKTATLTQENAKLKTELAAAADKAAKAENRATAAETNLASFQAEQRHKAIEARIDHLIAEDRLRPADKAAKMAFALALAKDGEEIELSAGAGKKTKLDLFLEDLAKAPKLGLLGPGFAAPENPTDTAPVDLTKHV